MLSLNKAILKTGSSPTNACKKVFKFEDQKDSAAMLAVKSSAGVAPEVNLRISLHAGKEVPGFETQDTHHQVQNTGISGSTKRTDVLQLKKKSFKNWLRDYTETT